MKRAFTLIELLVVIAIVALLMGTLLPTMGRARLQAKVIAVNAELQSIGTALEAYSLDNDGAYPPTCVDCMLGGHFYQLPVELAEGKYLPRPGEDTFMSTRIEDRFNRGYTYKYRSVGTLLYNRTVVVRNGSSLWIPDGFPDNERQEGREYADPRESPVNWVLYSEGPRFDLNRMKELKYPVPTSTWYSAQTRQGIIVRMRLANGRQIGSFESR
ncbi:MAG: type II secretion system protein [Planctomycetota bacterium]|jgi:prepilin-type N-terminal cleavage/methylation domain-containing protein